MAVQTIKTGYLLTLTAAEDELILLPPFNKSTVVSFANVSGTSKFGLGGPMSDTNYASVTTAGTVVSITVPDMLSQANPDPSMSVNRIHCSGVGTWRVTY